MKAVGFDSIKIELGAFSTRFEGLLGVGITVKNEDSFKGTYVSALKSLFSKRKINCERLVCKSAEIARFIPDTNNMLVFLQEFFDYINSEIERIDIYCTRFNSKKLPYITIFGEDRPERKKPVEFIRMISSGYPHICAWKYLSSFNKTKCTVYLDHFETYRTPAMDYLFKFPNISVLYKGDSCNCLISTADLFIRLTVLLLKKRKAHFNWKGLKNLHSSFAWKDKISANTLGGQTFILKNITPYTRQLVDLSQFIKHPVVFIPHENPGGLKAKEEQRLFENMPIYTMLLNFLFYVDGSFKFLDPIKDSRLIKDGDYILVMGKRGEELFEYIRHGGYNISKITLKDIEHQLQELENEKKLFH